MIEHARSEQYFPMRQREGMYSLFYHIEGQVGLLIGLLLGIALIQRNQGRFFFLALVLHRILARGASQR